MILAIDPGTHESGWCIVDPITHLPTQKGIADNEEILLHIVKTCQTYTHCKVVCEMVANYGMAVGKNVFETVEWIGRFHQQTVIHGHVFEHVYRTDIKVYLCNTVRATNANVRQALIDRYGGDLAAIGAKRCLSCNGNGTVGLTHCPVCGKGRRITCKDCGAEPVKDTCPDCHGTAWKYPPGPLHGFSDHMWSALAVAVYAMRDTQGGR